MRDHESFRIRALRLRFLLASAICAPGAAEAQSSHERGATEQVGEAQQRIEIHLVGDVAEFDELELLIPEWFMRDGLRVELRRHRALQPQDILSGAKGERAVRVWLTLLEERVARLYFSDSMGSRFLLREVPLPSGLDEIGREQLVHVLLAAASAFAAHRASTSKIDVARSFNVETSRSQKFAIANAPRASREAVFPHDSTSTAQASWTPRAGAWIHTAMQSADKVRWGPGLLLGVRRTSERSSVSLTAKLAYSAVGDEASGPVVLSSKILSLRFAVASDLLSSRWFRGGLEIGAGLDRVAFVPRVANGAPFTAREPGIDHRPLATAALSGAWVSRDWRLTVLVGASLSLVTVHYDIMLDAAQVRQLTPWLVQPYASLEASWQ